MAVALIVTMVFVLFVIYALERNERRQHGPQPPLAGSPSVPDRDLERTRDELTALSGRSEWPYGPLL